MIPHDLLATFTLNEIRELHRAYLGGFNEASRFFSTFQPALSRPDEFERMDGNLVTRAISAVVERLHSYSSVEQRILATKGTTSTDDPAAPLHADAFSRLTTFVSDGPIAWAGNSYPSAHCAAAVGMTCVLKVCESVKVAGLSAIHQWPGMTRYCDAGEVSTIQSRMALEAAEIEKAYANADSPAVDGAGSSGNLNQAVEENVVKPMADFYGGVIQADHPDKFGQNALTDKQGEAFDLSPEEYAKTPKGQEELREHRERCFGASLAKAVEQGKLDGVYGQCQCVRFNVTRFITGLAVPMGEQWERYAAKLNTEIEAWADEGWALVNPAKGGDVMPISDEAMKAWEGKIPALFEKARTLGMESAKWKAGHPPLGGGDSLRDIADAHKGLAMELIQELKRKDEQLKRVLADEPGEGRRAEGSAMTGEDRAISVLRKHSGWTLKQIADEAGVHVKTLHKYKAFKQAREILKQGRTNIPRGQKDADGNLEAWE